MASAAYHACLAATAGIPGAVASCSPCPTSASACLPIGAASPRRDDRERSCTDARRFDPGQRPSHWRCTEDDDDSQHSAMTEVLGADAVTCARRTATRGVVVTYPLGDARIAQWSHGGDAQRARAAVGGADGLRLCAANTTALRHPGDADVFRSERHAATARRPRARASGAKATSSAASCRIPSSPPRRSRTRLSTSHSRAPIGWCAEFPRRVADVVLEGCSAFAEEDALTAGRTLLERGPVRVKPGGGIAGLGQSVVDNVTDLDHRARSDRARGDVPIGRGRRAESRGCHDLQHRPGSRGGPGRHVLRHAVHDDEQSRRGSLRRFGAHRRARRFRRAARAAVVRKTSRSRSIRRAPTTPRRANASTACTRRAATTTSRRAATARAAGVRACSSNRGGSAARAARRSARWRRFARIRRCGSCAR